LIPGNDKKYRGFSRTVCVFHVYTVRLKEKQPNPDKPEELIAESSKPLVGFSAATRLIAHG
jgi:hypothetical protein